MTTTESRPTPNIAPPAGADYVCPWEQPRRRIYGHDRHITENNAACTASGNGTSTAAWNGTRPH